MKISARVQNTAPVQNSAGQHHVTVQTNDQARTLAIPPGANRPATSPIEPKSPRKAAKLTSVN